MIAAPLQAAPSALPRKGLPFGWLLFCAVLLGLTAWADAEVRHGAPLWVLSGVSLLLLQLMRVGRVSWFYAFMAVFFVLGCCFKVLVHHGLQYPYVEPSGAFNDSLAEWDEYYLLAILIGLALAASRVLDLLLPQRSALPTPGAVAPISPVAWLGLLLVVAVFYVINNLAAFFVTGVDAKLALPFGLNAPLAFMALIGFSLVLASWVDRDVQARGRLALGTVLVILFVSVTASLSMASRAAVVMQAVPILIGAYYLQSRWRLHRISLLPLLLFVLALVLVLVLVSLYRVRVFAGFSGGDSEMAAFFLLESASLVIDRWVGAEALMVAVAEPTRGVDLFLRLLAEDPAIGVDAIYQNLSGGKYVFLQGLTFLTLPGYFGVIGLTGSASLVFVLSFVMMVAGLAFERLVRALLRGQTLPTVLACAAVANALTQLSFPRLMLPFLFQMLVLCAFLGLAARRPTSSPAA